MVAAEMAFVPYPERWVEEGEGGGLGAGERREVKGMGMGGRVSMSDLF